MVASVVAGLGLATDSSTTVISSMLLSPVMGPVIGMSYGLVIWDLPLIRRSIRNELVSVLIGVAFGVGIGGACYWTPMAQLWPTHEMISRGSRVTFLAGEPRCRWADADVWNRPHSPVPCIARLSHRLLLRIGRCPERLG